MPELLATLESLRKQRENDQRFFAALQGVDLPSSDTNKTGEDVIKNARAKASGVNPDDVLSLSGKNAEEAGFGIGLGLGYEVE